MFQHPRSFRLRLALLSAMVSGVILLAFGATAWLHTQKQLKRIADSSIQLPLSRILGQVDRHTRWGDFDRRIDFVLGEEADDQSTALVIVDNFESEAVFRAGRHAWLTETVDIAAHVPDRETIEEFDRKVLEEGPRRPRPPEGRAPRRGPEGRARPGPEGPRRPPRGRTMPSISPARFLSKPGPDGVNWRIAAQSNPDVTVIFAMSLAGFDGEVQSMKRLFVALLPLGLFAIGVGGWLISRQAIRPLNRVTRAAAETTVTGLDRRIPKRGSESAEFSRLIDVFNEMTGRLEKNFHQATRFTADASHELKTPIALMQAEINSALKECAPGSREEAALHSVAEEVGRLKRIVQSLLLLSQVDAGGLRLARERFSLTDEMEALCEDGELLCQKAGLQFEGSVAGDLFVEADRTLLMQAVQNLLSNAIKYNEDGGHVSCTAEQSGDTVVIAFGNTGPPIPKERHREIFERFVRVDEARNRRIDGFGLGLNLAREIALAHGGDLVLSHSDDSGTEFVITIDAAVPEDLPKA